ncbi:hypothetical protein SLEP1_g5225 [Rubroshorea leprosula]|uniref:Reverse transcriptase domain-containing protein n=1 Tax=Rubroshorea leprosula TaxID=152421 RepID=A0AAV5HRK4_9ROSI|nr:hypothetical protein SLEP1_g5225 [Rubroshorea leprosula]
MEGLFSIKLRAMGGKLVLMDYDDKEELKELVESAKDWLGQWFVNIKSWTPHMVATERFVSLKCYGVPFHAWGPDFFISIANLWGNFITLDESTSSKKRFDVARFLISTSETGLISKTLTYKINGHMYCIKCKEEETTNGCFSLKAYFQPISPSNSEEDCSESWSSDYPSEDTQRFGQNGVMHGGDSNPASSEDDDDVAVKDNQAVGKSTRVRISKDLSYWNSANNKFNWQERTAICSQERQEEGCSVDVVGDSLTPPKNSNDFKNLNGEDGKQVTREGQWRQKARKQWLREGDANSKFYHKCISSRQRRKEIVSIQVNGKKLEDVDNIKNSISDEDEIKTAVWDCGSDKAPGPDGFNFTFFKKMWSEIKDDIVEFVQEFHKNGKLVKGLNVSFLTLIPKVKNPQRIEEFRPISLIGSLHLCEGFVTANEIIDEAKRKKKKSFVFKVDFEKAFDKVNWNFLDYMMMRLGFNEIWRKWIMECLQTSLLSVLVNGSPSKQFLVSRGLKQGDPLSPFLFLIVAEGLNKIINTAIDRGLYEGIKVGNSGMRCSHIQFADDTIIFGEASEKNIQVVKCTMRAFELASGRITFLNSVLTSLPVLFLSIYLTPKGIVKTLDKIRNKFLWGGCEESRQVHWVNWKTVCISKRDGGLGVKDLRLFNQALLGKWWGRLAKGSSRLLFNLIKEKYGYEGGNWCNWGFQIRIGNGEKVSFWKDSWSNTGVLANVFPRLYMLSTGKDNTIDEMGRWEDNKWVWNLPWRRTPHSWEQDSMQDFNKLLKETNLTIGKEDTWTWERDQLGDYSTSSRYTALVQHQPSPYRKVFEKIWNPLIPHKVYGFTWLLLLDRIPSKFNLLKRGLIKEMEAVKCSLCGRNVEESNHLFLHCSITAKIWSMCFEWWGFSTAIAGSCWDSFIQHESLATKSSERLARIDFAPYGGLNPPHTHPRGTEILVVQEGTLYVGLVSSNQDGNRLFTKVLNKGDVFVFPIGLIHFQLNIGKTPAVALSAFSTQNPGTITIADALFGSNPAINPDVLTKAFRLEPNVVKYLQSRF